MITKDKTLDIWQSLSTTDKAYTKDFKRSGGFSGTDINAQWRLMRLTEVFGPVGIGWGYEIVERWREDIGGEAYHFVTVRMWYLYEGEKYHTGEQIGGTHAKFAPDEGYKMAVTDAIGKCASQLGLGADVYLGQFDGKYSRPEAPREGKTEAPASKPNGTSTQLAKPASWQEVEIHFGKKKGTRLGDMEANDIGWWCENWQQKRTEEECKSDADRFLWRGLRAARQHWEDEQHRQEEAAVDQDPPF